MKWGGIYREEQRTAFRKAKMQKGKTEDNVVKEKTIGTEKAQHK